MKHHHRTIKCKEREISKNRKYNEMEKQGKIKEGKKKKEGFYAISEIMRTHVCLFHQVVVQVGSDYFWMYTQKLYVYDMIMGKLCAIVIIVI